MCNKNITKYLCSHVNAMGQKCTNQVVNTDKGGFWEEVTAQHECQASRDRGLGIGGCGQTTEAIEQKHSKKELCPRHVGEQYQDAYDEGDLGYGV